MHTVPNNRAEETERISERGSDDDESNGGRYVEWFHDVNRLNHMCPKNEVEDRLCPMHQHEHHPNHMPAANQRANDYPNLVWIGHFQRAEGERTIFPFKSSRNSVGD